jgi:hypothetical protein
MNFAEKIDFDALMEPVDSHGQPSTPLGAALDLFERGVS